MKIKLDKFDQVMLSFRNDTFKMEWGLAVKKVRKKLDKFYKKK